MLRTIFLTIAFASLFPFPSSSEEIIIKKGETLSEIASKYKISVDAIKIINGINDPNKVKAGDRISLPSNESNNFGIKETTHKVLEGETISSIATKYGFKNEEIIKLNNLRSADYIYLGQILKLPSNQIADQKAIASIPKKSSHVVKQGETLSTIALKYKTTLEELININGLEKPYNLRIGSELKLTAKAGTYLQKNSQQLDLEDDNKNWRSYGPLQIDWSSWQEMNGSHVAPTLHENGRSIYLAINCPARRFNATGTNGAWQDWIYPSDQFEHKLINDLCNSKKG